MLTNGANYKAKGKRACVKRTLTGASLQLLKHQARLPRSLNLMSPFVGGRPGFQWAYLTFKAKAPLVRDQAQGQECSPSRPGGGGGKKPGKAALSEDNLAKLLSVALEEKEEIPGITSI